MDSHFPSCDSNAAQYSCSSAAQCSCASCGRAASDPASRARAMIRKRYAIRMTVAAASMADQLALGEKSLKENHRERIPASSAA